MFVLMLTGCAASPRIPKVATGDSYRPGGDALVLPAASGITQHFTKAAGDERWWLAFGSAQINALVDRALAANPGLKAQDATLTAARELYRSEKSGLWPQISLGYSGQRARTADSLSNPLGGNNPPSIYSLHTAEVDVGYSPDIWGGGRQGLRAAKFQTEAVALQTAAARQALVANVVSAAIQAAALGDQLQAAERSVADSQRCLDYAQKQKNLGNLGATDVANAVNMLAQDQQTEIGLRHTLFVQQRLIAVLVGDGSAARIDAPTSLSAITLPGDLPMVLPVDIVNRRPDIRYAAAQFDSAAAAVNAAKAARLPALSLDGSTGGASTQLAALFNGGNSFWSVGVGIVQPLTGAVGLYHQQKASEAQLAAAQAQYQGTVQSALGNIADTLDALYADGLAADIADTQARTNEALFEDQKRQTELGQSGDIDVATADRAAAQARASQSLARSQRYEDTVALFLATGR
jgi:NodT family efflux transporter outer membrane factor (OMF) lipoprotein